MKAGDSLPPSGILKNLSADALREYGLVLEDGHRITGAVTYERPAYVFGHRIKDCYIGAFTYLNAAGASSAYRCRIGRYAQIAESSILGPPEHPQYWFTNHPFAYTRPHFMPNMYALPDFARLAPPELDGESYVDTVPSETIIGHEAYVGVGSFVKRGVTIGDGAVIGARSVVTRDVPPYALAVGAPARVVKIRFAEKLVERFLRLQWWRYDLAPFKSRVDYSQVEATLDFYEQKLSDGELLPLRPETYRLSGRGEELVLEKLPAPIYFA